MSQANNKNTKNWEHCVYHREAIYRSSEILIKPDNEIKKILDEVIDYRFNEFGKDFIEVMELKKFNGKRLLEVGGGCGSDAVIMAENGAKLTAVDIVPTNVMLVGKNLALRNLKCQTIFVPDLMFLKLPKNHFDVIYSFGCIHHIPNAKDVVEHLLKSLKPNGIIMLMLYHTSLENIDYNEGFTEYYNCKKAKKLLGDKVETLECKRFHRKEGFYLKVKGRKI